MARSVSLDPSPPASPTFTDAHSAPPPISAPTPSRTAASPPPKVDDRKRGFRLRMEDIVAILDDCRCEIEKVDALRRSGSEIGECAAIEELVKGTVEAVVAAAQLLRERGEGMGDLASALLNLLAVGSGEESSSTFRLAQLAEDGHGVAKWVDDAFMVSLEERDYAARMGHELAASQAKIKTCELIRSAFLQSTDILTHQLAPRRKQRRPHSPAEATAPSPATPFLNSLNLPTLFRSSGVTNVSVPSSPNSDVAHGSETRGSQHFSSPQLHGRVLQSTPLSRESPAYAFSASPSSAASPFQRQIGYRPRLSTTSSLSLRSSPSDPESSAGGFEDRSWESTSEESPQDIADNWTDLIGKLQGTCGDLIPVGTVLEVRAAFYRARHCELPEDDGSRGEASLDELEENGNQTVTIEEALADVDAPLTWDGRALTAQEVHRYKVLKKFVTPFKTYGAEIFNATKTMLVISSLDGGSLCTLEPFSGKRYTESDGLRAQQSLDFELASSDAFRRPIDKVAPMLACAIAALEGARKRSDVGGKTGSGSEAWVEAIREIEKTFYAYQHAAGRREALPIVFKELLHFTLYTYLLPDATNIHHGAASYLLDLLILALTFVDDHPAFFGQYRLVWRDAQYWYRRLGNTTRPSLNSLSRCLIEVIERMEGTMGIELIEEREAARNVLATTDGEVVRLEAAQQARMEVSQELESARKAADVVWSSAIVNTKVGIEGVVGEHCEVSIEDLVLILKNGTESEMSKMVKENALPSDLTSRAFVPPVSRMVELKVRTSYMGKFRQWTAAAKRMGVKTVRPTGSYFSPNK